MKHDLIELTEDQFDALYPLRTNHLNPHATWAFGGERGCLFETFGEELDFVRRQPPSTIWTLVDGEDGDMYLHSGMHFVNRIGYLVSLAAVPEGVDIQVRIPIEREEVEDAESGTEDASSRITHTPAPWAYRPEEDGKPITNGTVAIAYMDAYQPEEDDGGAWEKETEANARRIVAAVNACEGLSTEALELGIVTELLDALQAASDWIDTQTSVPRTAIQASIRAAIAKATEHRRPA
ncbi:MAG: hypothetical protein ABSG53_06445 [Thermoguttaceae bacterium]|jgi:hypothetical protein